MLRASIAIVQGSFGNRVTLRSFKRIITGTGALATIEFTTLKTTPRVRSNSVLGACRLGTTTTAARTCRR